MKRRVKMKKIVQAAEKIMTRHEELTRDKLVELLDAEIEALPEDQRASARFEIDEYGYAYDDNTYYALFIKWNRPETDEEEQKRKAQEAEWKAQQAARDRHEFERLKKQFGE